MLITKYRARIFAQVTQNREKSFMVQCGRVQRVASCVLPIARGDTNNFHNMYYPVRTTEYGCPLKILLLIPV